MNKNAQQKGIMNTRVRCFTWHKWKTILRNCIQWWCERSHYLICSHLSLHLITYFAKIFSHRVKISTVNVKLRVLCALSLFCSIFCSLAIKFHFLFSLSHSRNKHGVRMRWNVREPFSSAVNVLSCNRDTEHAFNWINLQWHLVKQPKVLAFV